MLQCVTHHLPGAEHNYRLQRPDLWRKCLKTLGCVIRAVQLPWLVWRHKDQRKSFAHLLLFWACFVSLVIGWLCLSELENGMGLVGLDKTAQKERKINGPRLQLWEYNSLRTVQNLQRQVRVYLHFEIILFNACGLQWKLFHAR